MSKIYDLYSSDQRKIDNWRRRIIGYEKMKRDNQREMHKLRKQRDLYKDVIEEVREMISELDDETDDTTLYEITKNTKEKLLQILDKVKEVK